MSDGTESDFSMNAEAEEAELARLQSLLRQSQEENGRLRNGDLARYLDRTCEVCGHTTTEDGCAYCIKKALQTQLICKRCGRSGPADELLTHCCCEIERPKIICICGSSRFADWAAVHSWNFSKMGYIVLSYELLPQWYWEATNKVGNGHAAEQEGVAHVLDELHLRKIDMADEVFIVNKDGYIGERTAIEIQYAKDHGKPVKFMEAIDAAIAREVKQCPERSS